MAEYYDSEKKEWLIDEYVHFGIKSDDDFELTACALFRVDGQIDFTKERNYVTCPKCIESHYFKNPHIMVI